MKRTAGIAAALSLVGVLTVGAFAQANTARNDWLYACWGAGLTYPLSVFEQSPGAEQADTPEAEALRKMLADPTWSRTLPKAGWRLLAREDDEVKFGARTPWYRGGHKMHEVTFTKTDQGEYRYFNSNHECAPSPTANENRAGSWRLDRDQRVPGPNAKKIRALVSGTFCASGRPPGKRLQQPMISYGKRRIVIAALEAPPKGFQTCQSSPPSPFTFELAERIGDRVVVDGGHLPFHRRVPARSHR